VSVSAEVPRKKQRSKQFFGSEHGFNTSRGSPFRGNYHYAEYPYKPYEPYGLPELSHGGICGILLLIISIVSALAFSGDLPSMLFMMSLIPSMLIIETP